MKITIKKKVNVFVGVYLTKDGEVGTSNYDDVKLDSKKLKQYFVADAMSNDCKPLKFTRIRSEKRLYEVDVIIDEDTPYTIAE